MREKIEAATISRRRWCRDAANSFARKRDFGGGFVTEVSDYVETRACPSCRRASRGAYKTSLTAFTTLTGVELGGVSRTYSGPDLGLGGEWRFSPNWSLWAEWDRIFPNDKTLFFPNLGVGGTTAVVRRDLDKVLVGVNYRFGGIGGPVVAAY